MADFEFFKKEFEFKGKHAKKSGFYITDDDHAELQRNTDR